MTYLFSYCCFKRKIDQYKWQWFYVYCRPIQDSTSAPSSPETLEFTRMTRKRVSIGWKSNTAMISRRPDQGVYCSKNDNNRLNEKKSLIQFSKKNHNQKTKCERNKMGDFHGPRNSRMRETCTGTLHSCIWFSDTVEIVVLKGTTMTMARMFMDMFFSYVIFAGLRKPYRASFLQFRGFFRKTVGEISPKNPEQLQFSRHKLFLVTKNTIFEIKCCTLCYGCRYCSTQRPSDVLTSASNEMYVIFKSNYAGASRDQTRGFRLQYQTSTTLYDWTEQLNIGRTQWFNSNSIRLI